MLETEKRALEFAEQGLKLFITSPNSKVPIKGSHGYKDATSDPKQIKQWFKKYPKANIALNLAESNLVCLDIDNHSGMQVEETLKELDLRGYKFDKDTYWEVSSSGGWHMFFKTNESIKATRKVSFIPNVDLLSDSVLIAPSVVSSKRYEALGTLSMDDVKKAPNWIIGALNKTTIKTIDLNKTIIKKYTGKLLDEIVQGTTMGSRNQWLTSLCGKLFNTGAGVETVYNILLFANDMCKEPLLTNEVDNIFKSIYEKVVNNLNENSNSRD